MKWKRYSEQLSSWPKSGRYIMAQFDEDTMHSMHLSLLGWELTVASPF
ncbi:MAG: hypothetical protein R3F19_20760 [Verrucomicrobiales bacterium]